MLKIYLDFKSPAAYLAFPPTLRLIDQYRPEVSWHPLKTAEETIPPAQTNETRGQTHRRIRALARQETHLLYARAHQIPMVFPDQPGETDLALATLSRLNEPPEDFIGAAFSAYWERGEDVNQKSVVECLLNQCGLDPTLAQIPDATEQLDALRQSALDQGVVNSPAYVIADQVFVGREHLPWIRELLDRSETR